LAAGSFARLSVGVIACFGFASALHAQLAADPAISCSQCEAWNAPQRPFRIFGNTYYVGTAELSAILLAGDDGLVLLDAALPQSAPLIARSIAELGFKLADVRLIVNSHTHFDHAGGIAALQRASGATVAASERAAEALRSGKPNTDDPQIAIAGNEFPAVPNVRVIHDGETLTVGNVAITARFTPGHTPGGTTWTWQSCEGSRCVDVVYADSLNPVSADEFRFSGGAGSPSIVESFERSIRTVAELPCDILLSPHPGFFGMQDKLRARSAGETDVFVNANACGAYASAAQTRLEQRIAEERAASR
jgi:metallo-beta-lactamase class B